MEAEAATVRAPALGRGWPSLRNSQRPFGVGGVRDSSGGVCSHQRWGQGHSSAASGKPGVLAGRGGVPGRPGGQGRRLGGGDLPDGGEAGSRELSAGRASLAERAASAKARRLGPARAFGAWSGPVTASGGGRRGQERGGAMGGVWILFQGWPCRGRGRVAGRGVTRFAFHVQKPLWTNLWSPGAAVTKRGRLGGLEQRKHITSRFRRPEI